MSDDVPADRRYLPSHEWLLTDDADAEGSGGEGDADATEGARVGISAFAQDELGDVVFVELPDVGQTVDGGEAVAVVESIKAVSDVYAPASGEVVAVNDALGDAPERVNDDPYGDGWLFALAVDDPSPELLESEAYRETIE